MSQEKNSQAPATEFAASGEKRARGGGDGKAAGFGKPRNRQKDLGTLFLNS